MMGICLCGEIYRLDTMPVYPKESALRTLYEHLESIILSETREQHVFLYDSLSLQFSVP